MSDFAALPYAVLRSVQWRMCEMVSSRPANFLRPVFQVFRDVTMVIFNLTIAN